MVTLEAVLADRPRSTCGRPPGRRSGHQIVAITSCPTGIAHTFMAAEGWEVRSNSAMPSTSKRKGRSARARR
jgi:hypothetical protein